MLHHATRQELCPGPLNEHGGEDDGEDQRHQRGATRVSRVRERQGEERRHGGGHDPARADK